MSSANREHDQNGVDLAINRVLEAERRARDEVERCSRQAAHLLTDADDRSRRIASRAEQRIRLAHGLADTGVALALQTMAAQRPIDVAAEEGTGALLDRVAGVLADEIIGIEP